MRQLARAIVVLMIITATALAAPHRVLVLPLDGNAEPSLRAKLNLTVQKLARSGLSSAASTVSLGDTTFSETAAAVGCDPAAPDCAETVRATLGVDELVWGTTTWTHGETNLTVNRIAAKQPARTASVLLAPKDGSEKADAELAPLFGGAAPVKDPNDTKDPKDTIPPVDPVVTPHYDNRKRNKGILLAAGGGISLLIGFALWSNASSVQQDIDDSPTANAGDFKRLEELESRAFKYAMIGNVMVLTGLAVGGYGGWIIYQDRKERSVVVTPLITPTTAGVAVGGAW